jgi:hypothetical protein
MPWTSPRAAIDTNEPVFVSPFSIYFLFGEAEKKHNKSGPPSESCQGYGRQPCSGSSRKENDLKM